MAALESLVARGRDVIVNTKSTQGQRMIFIPSPRRQRPITCDQSCLFGKSCQPNATHALLRSFSLWFGEKVKLSNELHFIHSGISIPPGDLTKLINLLKGLASKTELLIGLLSHNLTPTIAAAPLKATLETAKRKPLAPHERINTRIL